MRVRKCTDWRNMEKIGDDLQLGNRAGFLQIGGVEVRNEFIGMLEFRGGEPR